MLQDKRRMDNSMQFLFVEISRRYMGGCFRKITDIGIYPRQVPILMALREADGCSQKELAHRLEITAPTVNVSMNRLERSGIVYRKRDEADQRIMRIFLTPKGIEIIGKLTEYHQELEEQMFGSFSETERCLLRRFFEQILENIHDMPNAGLEDFSSGNRNK